MTDRKYIDRPELLMGPNPLIEAVPPFIPMENLAARLTHYPLQDVPWRSIPPVHREALLEEGARHFAATRCVLEPAAGIQMLIRRSLILRNPLNPGEKRRSNQIAMISDYKELKTVIELDGHGGMFAGITGMGKTFLAKRCIEIFLPDQVIDHGPSAVGGWIRLRQCTYLFVGHPANGARLGLVTNILMALDRALGTNYMHEYGRRISVENGLGIVAQLLSNHRVAILIVDENQQRNLDESPWHSEFALFYLSLMNLGVSVLLMGNPLAFRNFHPYSQLVRRLSSAGNYCFEVARTATEPWWCEDYVPRRHKFSLVEKVSVPKEVRARHEFQASAGNPALFQVYDGEVQRIALRRGGESAELVESDYEEALRSPRYRDCLAIANSISNASMTHRDIPANGNNTGDDGEGILKKNLLKQSMTPPEVMEGIKSRLSRFKADTTRRTNLLAKQLALRDTLSEDDIRRLVGSDELLAGSIETQTQIEQRKALSSVKKPRRKA
ncbi:MAG: AAA family ATPase [Burkholderiaceae bacterium]|nr:AAA family ATPase [Burkholderiaceae bacterium]